MTGEMEDHSQAYLSSMKFVKCFANGQINGWIALSLYILY